MRLIDADALFEEIFGDYNNFENVPNDLAAVAETIGNAPTIDPVRHGRWNRLNEWPKRTYRRLCNVCQDVAYYCGQGDYNFCPNCGARMDGEE